MQELKKHVLESQQFLYQLAPDTLLSIELAAPLLGKSPATVRTNISVCPSLLPAFVRSGRRVFFIKKDIDAFLASRRVNIPNSTPAHSQTRQDSILATPITKRRGRPTKAQAEAKKAAAAAEGAA